MVVLSLVAMYVKLCNGAQSDAASVSRRRRRKPVDPSALSQEIENLANWKGYDFESANCIGKESCLCEQSTKNIITAPHSITYECSNPDYVICDVSFASFGVLHGSCEGDKKVLQQGQCNDAGVFRQMVEKQCLNENRCVVSSCSYLNFLDGGYVGDENELEMYNALESNTFDSYTQNYFTDVKGISDDLNVLLPSTTNRSIDSLGFGVMLEKCVPREECAFSLFDQVRLGIRTDGNPYLLPQRSRKRHNGGSSGRKMESPTFYDEIRISTEDRLKHKKQASKCMEQKTSDNVCRYETPLLLPSKLEDIYLTLRHPKKPFVVEVSGVEPLVLTVHSKGESADSGAMPVFEKSHKFVKSKVENNYNCGNLKRILHFSADETKGNSVGSETLTLKLTDGLGRTSTKEVNVIMAARPAAKTSPRYTLTANTPKAITIQASGVLPLTLKYQRRQSDFSKDGKELQVSIDVSSSEAENSFTFKFQPTEALGTVVYALKVIDANGAAQTEFVNVEIIAAPTYSFSEIDDYHNEIILTAGHTKELSGEVRGYEPLTFLTTCETRPVRVEVTGTNTQDKKNTKATFKAVLPSFSSARQELVPCKVSLKDGNGATKASTFYVRIAPLPGFDFSTSSNPVIYTTVGFIGSTKIPRSYGYTPLTLKLLRDGEGGIGSNELLSPGAEGAYVTHPDKDSTVLNIRTVKAGVANLGIYLIDANGVKGKTQNIRLVSVEPPTIKLENTAKHSKITVDPGQTVIENIPIIISGYKALSVHATSSRTNELPNDNIKVQHAAREISTTSEGDGIIHESRQISINIPPGNSPILSVISVIVTDDNAGNSTALQFTIVRKGPRKKSKYEIWKEKQRL